MTYDDSDITAERAIEAEAAQLLQAHVDQLDNDSAPPPIPTAHPSATHDTPQDLPAFEPEMVKARNFHPVSDPKALINMPTSLERDAIAAVPTPPRVGQIYNDLAPAALVPRVNDETHPLGAPLSPSIPQTERFIATFDELVELPSGGHEIRTWAFRLAHDTTAYAMIASTFLDRTWMSHGYALLQRAHGHTNLPLNADQLTAARDAYARFSEAPNALHDVFFAVFDMGDGNYDGPLSQAHLVTLFCSKDATGNRSTIMHFSAPKAAPRLQPDGSIVWHPEQTLGMQLLHPAAFSTDVAKGFITDAATRIDNTLAEHGWDMGRLPILKHLGAEPIKRAVDRVHDQAEFTAQLNDDRHVDIVNGLRAIISGDQMREMLTDFLEALHPILHIDDDEDDQSTTDTHQATK